MNIRKRVSTILQCTSSENQITTKPEQQSAEESTSVASFEDERLQLPKESRESATPKRLKLDYGDLHFDVYF